VHQNSEELERLLREDDLEEDHDAAWDAAPRRREVAVDWSDE